MGGGNQFETYEMYHTQISRLSYFCGATSSIEEASPSDVLSAEMDCPKQN